METTWKKFESDCYNYLRKMYPQGNFEPKGQENSTESDICVVPQKGKPFYVEVKSSKAQCGQFVLIPDRIQHRFIYSSHTPVFTSTETIIRVMNMKFDDYVNAGTKGQEIPLDKSIFYDWVVSYYKWKGVRFFITKGDEYMVFPVDKIEDYFDIFCRYRAKKSGSSNPCKNNLSEIEGALLQQGIGAKLHFDGKKLYANTDVLLDKQKIEGEKYTYLFQSTSNGDYLIRRLSNTCNSNVIFRISLKTQKQNPADLLCFENHL